MNPKEFSKTKRDPVTESELERALSQAPTAPVEEDKSEKREPTEEELNQKWKRVGK